MENRNCVFMYLYTYWLRSLILHNSPNEPEHAVQRLEGILSIVSARANGSQVVRGTSVRVARTQTKHVYGL